MFRSRITTAALAVIGAAAAVLSMAGAASASSPPQPPKVTAAATFVQDRPDSGNAGDWADDTMFRTLVITRTGGTPGAYTFTARLTDSGAFVTIKGALAPNQGGSYAGEVVKARVAGFMEGYADFSFTASTLPSSSLVPRSENDHGLVPADSTSLWYELAFPAGTTFGGAGIGQWGWTYFAFTPRGPQFWADTSGNGAGDLAGDGQITG